MLMLVKGEGEVTKDNALDGKTKRSCRWIECCCADVWDEDVVVCGLGCRDREYADERKTGRKRVVVCYKSCGVVRGGSLSGSVGWRGELSLMELFRVSHEGGGRCFS